MCGRKTFCQQQGLSAAAQQPANINRYIFGLADTVYLSLKSRAIQVKPADMFVLPASHSQLICGRSFPLMSGRLRQGRFLPRPKYFPAMVIHVSCSSFSVIQSCCYRCSAAAEDLYRFCTQNIFCLHMHAEGWNTNGIQKFAQHMIGGPCYGFPDFSWMLPSLLSLVLSIQRLSPGFHRIHKMYVASCRTSVRNAGYISINSSSSA